MINPQHTEPTTLDDEHLASQFHDSVSLASERHRITSFGESA